MILGNRTQSFWVQVFLKLFHFPLGLGPLLAIPVFFGSLAQNTNFFGVGHLVEGRVELGPLRNHVVVLEELIHVLNDSLPFRGLFLAVAVFFGGLTKTTNCLGVWQYLIER